MTREKEPKITISKEAALLITDKTECEKLLNEVQNVRGRAEKIIKRRRIEIDRLAEIECNLKKRLEFLDIVPVIEPDTWYSQQRQARSDNTFVALCTQENSVSGWQFSIDSNRLDSGWRKTNYVFLHPTTNQLIIDPPKQGKEVVVEKHIHVRWTSYSLKGHCSFLQAWTPSSQLGVVVQDPDIMEVRGLLDDMYAKKSPRCIKKSHEDDDDQCREAIHLVKYNKEWHILLTLD